MAAIMGVIMQRMKTIPKPNKMAAIVLCALTFCVFMNNVMAEAMNNNVDNGPSMTKKMILRNP